tara:strand:- start:134 stop:811 length:678 start_codon:yes stop_codon:yes gene_type:complete
MKNIIIYTTNDKIISLNLVNHIIASQHFKSCKIDIMLNKPSFVRKLKMALVILFFGSFVDVLKSYKKTISIKEILKKNPNCNLVSEIKKKYDFGLSVNSTKKIKLENFKIYNFHLGSLLNQRGSFIFFYKFINNWNEISLTFHEITEKFDVGKIINERKINFKNNYKATDIIYIYLKNLDFLNESLDLIDKRDGIMHENYEKLNLVPSFNKLIKEILKYFFNKKK